MVRASDWTVIVPKMLKLVLQGQKNRVRYVEKNVFLDDKVDVKGSKMLL